MESDTPSVSSMSGMAMSPRRVVVRAIQVGTVTLEATTATVMMTAQVKGERRNGRSENVPENSGPPRAT